MVHTFLPALIFVATTCLSQAFLSKDLGRAGFDTEGVTTRASVDGGYYIAGSIKNRQTGLSDAHLIKTDAMGKLLWEKTYGGARDDYGWGMRVLKNGDVIITGFTDSRGAGKDDVLVIRTDARGNQKWLKTFGGPYDDRSWDVIEGQNNTIVLVGEYAKADNKTNLDGWILQLDADGRELSSVTFGGDKLDRLFSIACTGDNGFIMAGFSNSSGAGDYDMYLVKTNSEGKEEWHKTFGGKNFDVGHTVQPDGNNGYMIVGYNRSVRSNGKGDAWIVKTDLNGNLVKEKTFGDEVEERTLTFTKTTDGYVLLGYAEIDDRNWDVYVVKADKDLETFVPTKFGSPGLDTGGHNIIYAGNEVVFTGYMNERGNDRRTYITGIRM